MLKLRQDRTTRILRVVVIVMGAAIVAGTAVLVVALVDLAGQLGSGSPPPPASGPHG